MSPRRQPDLDLIFAALADPTRRALLTQLLDGERNVSDLARPFEISLAGVSKHLRLLTEAGLVDQRRAGREKTCRLDPDGLNAAFIWMQGFGAVAGVDLEAVERYLENLLGEDYEDGDDGDPPLPEDPGPGSATGGHAGGREG